MFILDVPRELRKSFSLVPRSPSFKACTDFTSCQWLPGRLLRLYLFILCLFYYFMLFLCFLFNPHHVNSTSNLLHKAILVLLHHGLQQKTLFCSMNRDFLKKTLNRSKNKDKTSLSSENRGTKEVDVYYWIVTYSIDSPTKIQAKQ